MKRPLLPSNRTSEPYWSSLAIGEMRVQRCEACERLVFYPREICPYCSEIRFGWEIMSGKGRVYSYTVIRKPHLLDFIPIAPYIYALVELDEGVRIASNLINCTIEAVTIGMPVRAVYESAGERTVVLFEPDSEILDC